MTSPERTNPFRLVCTLGPAVDDLKTLTTLVGKVSHFRLNGSHLDTKTLNAWLSKLSSVYEQNDREIPLILDLQGAKMRIGSYANATHLPARVRLVNSSATSPFPDVIPVPHERLFRTLSVGEELTLNDNRIRLVVTELSTDCVFATVKQNGPLSSRKGINRADHPIPFDGLSNRDEGLLQVALDYPFVSFALSFVSCGEDAKHLRNLTERNIVAKIERPETFSDLAQIDEAFDELWFCRGDLGAQAGLTALGKLQLQFEKELVDYSKPALLAGQALEHMTHFRRPTRAEIVGLYRAIVGPWSGIVLSDETAVGKFPLETVTLVNDLIKAARDES